MAEVFFFLAAIGALAGALGTVALRNPFYSVLALVVHLLSLAALFMLLRAEFVAAAQGLAEGAVGAADRSALRGADDLDDVGSRIVRHYQTTTRIAVTRALSVASGRKIFQPSDISWS